MLNITETALKVLDTRTTNILMNKHGQILVRSFLSTNQKLEKGVATVGFHMLPHDVLNNYLKEEYRVTTVCPMAVTAKCDKICIGEFAGHFAMKGGAAHHAQIKRSLALQFHRAEAVKEIAEEILTNAPDFVRMNVFSDVNALSFQVRYAMNKLIQGHPVKQAIADNVKFYDYTKNIGQAAKFAHETGTTIAASISKAYLGNIQEEKALSFINTNKIKYSAIVSDDKEATIQALNSTSNVIALDGDKIDNFVVYQEAKHIVLVLSIKGTKKTIKQLVRETFALTTQEAVSFYKCVLDFSNAIV